MEITGRRRDGPGRKAPQEPDSGFSLLEVVIALAVLTVALLGIARGLGSATRFAAAAHQARLANEAATTLSATLSGATLYPDGWIPVGGVGADGVVGTLDDPPRHESPCRRRVTALTTGDVQWWWVQAQCGALSENGDEPPPGGRVDLLVGR